MINSFPTTQKTQCFHYKERIVLLVKKKVAVIIKWTLKKLGGELWTDITWLTL